MSDESYERELIGMVEDLLKVVSIACDELNDQHQTYVVGSDTSEIRARLAEIKAEPKVVVKPGASTSVLTKRDMIAAIAMHGLLSDPHIAGGEQNFNTIKVKLTRSSMMYADALIAELEKTS